MRASAIDVRVQGADEIVVALTKMSGPAADKLLRDAMAKGAQAMKPFVKAQAPSGGPGGRTTAPTHPGDLRKSISMKRGRRSRPPAAIVYPKKTGWYSKWVIAGTKPHRIRFPDQAKRRVPKEEGNIAHPGVTRPNPYMTRGGQAGTAASMAAVSKHVAKYIDSLG